MKFRLLNTTYQNISSIRPPANLEFYLTLLHKCNKFDPKNQDICLSPIQGVHIVIDGNVAYSLAGEIDFRVLTGQDIVSSQTG